MPLNVFALLKEEPTLNLVYLTLFKRKGSVNSLHRVYTTKDVNIRPAELKEK